jgi:ribosome biogenesis protein UTP30
MAEQIDSHVSVKQAQLAINALHKHALKVQKEKEESELLPGKEQNIWLVIGVKKIYPEGKLKPFKV